MRHCLCPLLLAASALQIGPAAAQLVTEETQVQFESEMREGAVYRERHAEAVAAIRSGDAATARAQLNEIRGYCDSVLESSERPVVSVANSGEFARYLESRADDAPVRWIDFVCPSTYQMLAFLFVNARDFDSALADLGTAADLAPYWAQPHLERGYILNQLGRFQEALFAYQSALQLSEDFESSRDVRPVALRGAGFALIELGRLAAAREVFEESLELDPGNELAKNELRYIDQLEASQNR